VQLCFLNKWFDWSSDQIRQCSPHTQPRFAGDRYPNYPFSWKKSQMTKLTLAILGFILTSTQMEPGFNGKLAYTFRDDIWVKTLPDGALHQISLGGGAGSPQWSPSGEWLAFRQNGKVIVVSMAGERREIPAGQIAWSPELDEAAFTDQEGLWIIRFDGNEPQKRLILRNTTSISISGPVWNPDGSALAISVIQQGPAGKPEFRTGHLWRVNIDGTQAQEIFTPSEQPSGASAIGWSCGGRCILALVDESFSASIAADGLPLISVRADGGPERALAPHVLTHADFMSVPARRPQVMIVRGIGRETWTEKQLVLADPVTGQSQPLTDTKSAIGSVAWSPNGDWIAYVSGPDIGHVGGGDPAKRGLSGRRIWIMNPDTRQSRQLTADVSYRDEYPIWSADSQHIVFIRMDQQDKASVWSVAIDGGTLRRIVDEIDAPSWFGYYGHIGWSIALSQK
jgi:Tol biopolymer transport system component